VQICFFYDNLQKKTYRLQNINEEKYKLQRNKKIKMGGMNGVGFVYTTAEWLRIYMGWIIDML